MDFFEGTRKELQKFKDFVYKDGALDKKTKFLIAFSNSVALGCEPCMISRFRRAKDEFNCSDEEIEEALAIGVLNAAGTTEAKLRSAYKKYKEGSETVCKTC